MITKEQREAIETTVERLVDASRHADWATHHPSANDATWLAANNSAAALRAQLRGLLDELTEDGKED